MPTSRAQVNRRQRRKKLFLEDFALGGIVGRAATAAGVERTTVYLWLEHDETFAQAFRQAELRSVEVLEEEARRRAVDGVEKPVYQNGKLVGHVREYSDTLLIFTLKARAPDKYRERFDLRASVQVQAVGYAAADLELIQHAAALVD